MREAAKILETLMDSFNKMTADKAAKKGWEYIKELVRLAPN